MNRSYHCLDFQQFNLIIKRNDDCIKAFYLNPSSMVERVVTKGAFSTFQLFFTQKQKALVWAALA